MQLCVFEKQAVVRKFCYASIYNWTENEGLLIVPGMSRACDLLFISRVPQSEVLVVKLWL